jgi:hypothetical protein
MSDEPTLAFIGKQLDRLLNDVADLRADNRAVRDDITVLTAMTMRVDKSLGRVNDRLDRIDDRIRKLEDAEIGRG